MDRKRLVVLIQYGLLILCSLLLVKTISDLGPDRIFQAARSADPLWLAACFLPLIARFLVWAWKWKMMLVRHAPVSFWFVTRLILAAGFVNLVTPTAKLGGGVLRAMSLFKKRQWPLATSFGYVFADQLTNALGKSLLFGVTLMFLLAGFAPAGMGLKILLLAVFSLAFVFLWVGTRTRLWDWCRQPQRGAVLRKWLPKRLKAARSSDKGGAMLSFLEPLLVKGKPAHILGNDILGAGISFGLFCWSNAIVLRALGADAPMALIILAVMLGYLGGTALGVMGGIGVTELFLIKGYTMIGIPEDLAIAGALLHRSVFYLFILLVGGIAVWGERQLFFMGRKNALSDE